MTLTGRELAAELRSARDQMMSDASFASDAEVARLALFGVYALLGRLADWLHPEEARLPGEVPLFPLEEPRERIEFVTPAQIAELLPISLTTVYQLLRSGVIPAKRVGSRWVIRRTDFENWERDS
jgi:excisionase family DNA binding protein